MGTWKFRNHKVHLSRGQSQEAIRDWDHAQLGIGEFEKAAQTARTQGIDLYGVAQDRLAYAYEFTAKVMLGNDIDIYGTLSTSRMDTIKDIYQSIYDYYINVKGTELPYTKQFIQKHVHPAFSIGTLTGLKYHPVKSRQMMKTLPVLDFLKPTEIGALNAPTRDIPSGSIRVNLESPYKMLSIDTEVLENVLSSKKVCTY